MKTDVLVVGSGPSAAAAAITASRMGAKTTLMLRYEGADMGGGLCAGEFFEWCGSASSGIWEEVKERMGPGMYREGPNDPARLSCVLREMVQETKTEVIGKSLISADRTKDGLIEDILVSGKTHRPMRIAAKVYIDATGTAELAREAGATLDDGPEYGEEIPVGADILLETANDWPGDRQMGAEDELIQRMQARMDEAGARFTVVGLTLLKIGEDVCGGEKISRIAARLNGRTGYSVFDWSGHRRISWGEKEKFEKEAIRFLMEELKTPQGLRLVRSSVYRGLWRAADCPGKYRLTEKDICEGRVFEDWVVSDARCGTDSQIPENAGIETPEYTIPYRSLLPADCGNLLLTGRGICATDLARRAVSSAPVAFALGEAAGAAAALAVRRKCAPGAIDAENIQLERMNRGAKGPRQR